MRYKFHRWVGDDLEGLDLEELLSKLSDLLMGSGFDNPYGDPDDTSFPRQALHDAILDALLSGGLLSDETLERLLGDPADADARSQIEQLIERLIEQLTKEGYLVPHPGSASADASQELAGDEGGGNGRPVEFEVTDKGLDFLGYRALRDLLGSRGRSAMGRHDTRELATGTEAEAAPKPYEFGETLNLDASATILNAVRRGGLPIAHHPVSGNAAIDVREEDLMVAQGEYQSSCATVLLLDCSHSMILYGEDRFTPAKRVALALSNLIRHQYPGDDLRVVLFHDAAEEIPLARLARVRVGPYYTNTREGLRMARRILERQQKDMRQIVMITDGKPSAITHPDGRIYRNAFGLDPLIVSETFAEVSACRRAGIMINTFMLARDYDLVAFVRRVAEICRGKAYFTTPFTLGQYVLMDYLTKKTRTVH
jgi:Ca-activated chloride channel family protein